MAATIVALHQSHAAGAPLSRLDVGSVKEEAGLEGDRHSKPGSRRALLLMEQEVLDLFGLSAGAVREQVTVRGIKLHQLALGSRLRIGEVLLEVGAPCDPCELMDEIRPGLQQELQGRRGRFVRVVQGGAIEIGAPITVEPPHTT